MRIDVLTGVPELLVSPLNHSILKRAMDKSLAEVYIKTLLMESKNKNRVELLKTNKRSGALLKLFFNQVDAAVVTKKTYDFVV